MFRRHTAWRVWTWGVIGIALLLTQPASGDESQQDVTVAGFGQGRLRLIAQTPIAELLTDVEVSPDGKLLLTDGDATVRLWDIGSGRLVRELTGHSHLVRAVAFSKDGRSILSSGYDTFARLWNRTTGELIQSYGPHEDFGSLSAAFSPDEGTIVTIFDSHKITLWDRKSGEMKSRFGPEEDRFTDVDVSPDGKHVATSSFAPIVQIWDVETGQRVRQIDNHGARVNSVRFSPDGKQLLTASFDRTARIWDVETGFEEVIFAGHFHEVWEARYSPDGKRVVTCGQDGTARVWDAATGDELRRITVQNAVTEDEEWVTTATFSPDGRHIVTGGYDNTPRLWELESGKLVREFKSPALQVEGVAVSHDGTAMATCGDLKHPEVRLWDLRAGRQIRRFVGHGSSIRASHFSSDQQRLATASWDDTVRIWNTRTGTEIHRLQGGESSVNDVRFSPDDKLVVGGSSDGTAHVWDAQSGHLVKTLSGHTDSVERVRFSPDGGWLVTSSFDGTSRVYGVRTWEVVKVISEEDHSARRCVFSPDGKQLITGAGKVIVWDMVTWEKVRTFGRFDGAGGTMVLSPDGRLIVLGGDEGHIGLWDVSTGTERLALKGHTQRVTTASFTPDGKYLFTVADDHTCRLWDVAGGRSLCMMVSFQDGDWAVIDSAGRYDAANAGDVDGLHWVVDEEPIALAQLKGRYYEPGLLAKLLGFDNEPLRDVATFGVPDLYPDMELVKTDEEGHGIQIRLTNRGGGIGRVAVKVNGKELTADARGGRIDAGAERATLDIDLTDDPRLIPGEDNVVEVVAYNAQGYLASRDRRVRFVAPRREAKPEPEVWSIVAGVSDYRGDAIDLRYAAKDATDFAKAVQLSAGRLFDTKRVHLTLLSTEETDPTKRPTRANLLAALEAARSSRASDILVVYLAGHGVNYGGQDGDFYYLTEDAQNADLADPELRAQTAISSDELTESIREIPALKQVMILDTCASGRLIQRLSERRNVPSSQIRALERVKDRTGIHILAGCAADAVSYEASRYGQGLLTHSLLLGIRGAALRDNEYVDVSRLFNFAADRVPDMARDIGGVQRPVITSPKGGGSFDIGRLTPEDRDAVPLQSPLPLVLRANFQDALRPRDTLSLARLVNERLRDASVRGSKMPLVFVDAVELPGAYEIGGRYTVAGNDVSVDVALFQGDRDVAGFRVTGNRERLSELAGELVRQIQTRLKQE